MRKVVILGPLMGFLLLANSSWAQDYEDHPGYMDLSFVRELGEVKSTLELHLTPGLARLFGAIDDDAGFEEVLRKLFLINAYTVAVNSGNRDDIEAEAKQLAKSLRSQGWRPFLAVSERDESTEILLKETEDEIQGMVIVSVKWREASFVNIVGSIDIDSLGKLSRKMNIRELETLEDRI